MEIKVFDYIENLDCFLVSRDFREVCNVLGLKEWDQTAWIGRFFMLDNDYGEHWFDNWELREKVELEAKKIGIESDQLLIIDPDRFKDDKDGPCHNSDQRKSFWTSTLKSLHLDINIIIEEARLNHQQMHESSDIEDLEKRIRVLLDKYKIFDK